jgi:hypothetical protein
VSAEGKMLLIYNYLSKIHFCHCKKLLKCYLGDQLKRLEYYQKTYDKEGKKVSSNSTTRKLPESNDFMSIKDDYRCSSENKRIVKRSKNLNMGKQSWKIHNSFDEDDELATFLALECETQKEVLKDEAFGAEDILIDQKDKSPYFVQNLVNVMNNKKVDKNSDKMSYEGSLDKRTSDRTILAQSYYNKKTNLGSIPNYMSISLVKENKPDLVKKHLKSAIKFHNTKSNKLNG